MRVMRRTQEVAVRAWPRIAKLLQQPGTAEIVRSLSGHLARRFAARAIKFVVGGEMLLGLGGAENGKEKEARAVTPFPQSYRKEI